MSRTSSSIRNLKFALVGQITGIILNFFARQVFVVYLSTEYLGLSGLFSDILTVLSVAELGIGSAIVFSLYKPIAHNDIEEIKSLMRLFKVVYRIIGVVVLAAGCALTPFIGVFVEETPDIPNIRIFYLMCVANASISFFYTYKRSLIIANQKHYVTTLYHSITFIILTITQIFTLILTGNFYLFLGLRVAASLLENILLSRKANIMYPYLKDTHIIPMPDETSKTIKKNVLATICHNIGGIVVNGTDNLLLAGLAGLNEVGLYSNYILITQGLNTVIKALFQSIIASIGNLNAKKNETGKIETVYRLNFAGAWISGFSSVCLWVLLNPFIEIWLGAEYLFTSTIVFWIVVNFYVSGMRCSVLAVRDAMGLYWHDRYKPIAEALINLIVSIILGRKIGVTGIFIGTFISTIATCFWVEPFVLFKRGFNAPVAEYFMRYAMYTTVTLIAAASTVFLCEFVHMQGLLGFVIKIVICIITPNMIYISAYHKSAEFHYFIELVSKILRSGLK